MEDQSREEQVEDHGGSAETSEAALTRGWELDWEEKQAPPHLMGRREFDAQNQLNVQRKPGAEPEH